ncbi:MAG: hypothetical protein NTV43_16130 [Methylococcales bacterium]|nr:hypothetical protein [Methylococcales bacterium]
MLTHTHKTAGQALKGAGDPALPLVFPCVIADGKNQVRKSLAGRRSSMNSFREIHRIAGTSQAPNQTMHDQQPIMRIFS